MIQRFRPDGSLNSLRLTAERIAAQRREQVTTTHLLCAIADSGGPTWELLRDRKLSPDAVLRAARNHTDDDTDPMGAALGRAEEVARSMRAREAGAVHLLVALVSQRRSAAYRALEQFGVDLGRLRVAAMNAGLGQLGRRPIQTRRDGAQRRHENKAVTVPLTPAPRPITSRGGVGADSSSARVVEAAPQLPVEEKRPERSPTPTPPTSTRQVHADRPRKARGTGRHSLDKRRFKTLSTLGRNLSQLADRGELPEVVGRDALVEQVLDVLAKRDANNPCLVGPPGVGKTCLVHAVAQRIGQAVEEGRIQPGDLDDRIIFELNVSELLSGTGLRGALGQRISEVQKEVSAANGRVVVFIDDLHQLLTSGGDEAVAELQRALSAGMVCIAATNPVAFGQLEGDSVFQRLFSFIEVGEPELDEACDVVASHAARFAEHHELQITDQACGVAVAWTARYVQGRALPDKALAVLDHAAARCRRRGITLVEPRHVAEVVSEDAEVPLDRLLETDGERLLRLEETLRERVVGHTSELATLSRIVRRNGAGLCGDRPIGTFLLLGPTGVGKTETAKALAAALFGTTSAMTRLDLSEYSEAHSVARLIGAPPGYLGHEAGGQLTEAVRKRPYQVLLLDEVEKAHQEVLETFLPLFDEGRLTDGRGRTVDFTNTVIMLTSNIGAREAAGGAKRRVGFGERGQGDPEIQNRVVAAARERLSPEFFNRLDEVLVFKALGRHDVEEIAKRLLQNLADNVLEQRDVRLCIDSTVVGYLLDKGGFDATLGARPMRRAIARWVEAPLAEALLSDRLSSGQTARLTVEADELLLDVEAAAAE